MQTINKTEALKRLAAIKDETKELERIINAPEKITDRVKTYEDACEVLGIDPDDDDFDELESDEIAYIKLKRIVRALNEGWKPNWDNSIQYKWYPWFYMQTSGFGLYVARYDRASTHVGSRLCFQSEELAIYAAKQFKDIYQDYFTL